MRRKVAAAAALCLLLGWFGWSVHALDRARRARNAARDTVADAASIARAGGFAAADAASARAALSAWLGDRAAATGVRLSLTPLASADEGVVRLRLSARADEAALRRFIRAVELPGLMEPGRWSIAARDDLLLLTAEASAPWRRDGGRPLPPGTAPAVVEDRALFAAAATDATPQAPGAAPDLVGIVGRLPGASAIVRTADGGTHVLAVGDEAEGWRLTAIAPDRATLVRAGRAHVAVLPANSR